MEISVASAVWVAAVLIGFPLTFYLGWRWALNRWLSYRTVIAVVGIPTMVVVAFHAGMVVDKSARRAQLAQVGYQLVEQDRDAEVWTATHGRREILPTTQTMMLNVHWYPLGIGLCGIYAAMSWGLGRAMRRWRERRRRHASDHAEEPVPTQHSL